MTLTDHNLPKLTKIGRLNLAKLNMDPPLEIWNFYLKVQNLDQLVPETIKDLIWYKNSRSPVQYFIPTL